MEELKTLLKENNNSRRVFLWLFLFLLGIFIYQASLFIPQAPGQAPPDPKIGSSQLRLGEAARDVGIKEIVLNDPTELDFKSRAEVFEIRKHYVLKYPELLEGKYSPSRVVFGQITDGKPWWGLDGQYCLGQGQKSIHGPSEETRFLANPFILLAVDEAAVWVPPGKCFPVYPRPVSLVWDAQHKTATVTYDMTRYWGEWRRVMTRTFGPKYQFVNYNARDFGYNYLAVVKANSPNAVPYGGAKMFEQPIYMQAFIHTGGSCGYPGGCNNQSPFEADLQFWIKHAPAQMQVKLWKNRPKSIRDPEDFLFIIKFQ